MSVIQQHSFNTVQFVTECKMSYCSDTTLSSSILLL